MTQKNVLKKKSFFLEKNVFLKFLFLLILTLVFLVIIKALPFHGVVGVKKQLHSYSSNTIASYHPHCAYICSCLRCNVHLIFTHFVCVWLLKQSFRIFFGMQDIFHCYLYKKEGQSYLVHHCERMYAYHIHIVHIYHDQRNFSSRLYSVNNTRHDLDLVASDGERLRCWKRSILMEKDPFCAKFVGNCAIRLWSTKSWPRLQASTSTSAQHPL